MSLNDLIIHYVHACCFFLFSVELHALCHVMLCVFLQELSDSKRLLHIYRLKSIAIQRNVGLDHQPLVSVSSFFFFVFFSCFYFRFLSLLFYFISNERNGERKWLWKVILLFFFLFSSINIFSARQIIHNLHK